MAVATSSAHAAIFGYWAATSSYMAPFGVAMGSPAATEEQVATVNEILDVRGEAREIEGVAIDSYAQITLYNPRRLLNSSLVSLLAPRSGIA